MLKILITAATEKELMAVPRELPEGISADFMVTGIGPVMTSYLLTKQLLMNNYHFVLNTGICGSFDRKFPIGKMLHITTDEFGDIGTPTKTGFSTVFEMGFGDKEKFPFSSGKLVNKDAELWFSFIKQATAITVSSVTSTNLDASERLNKFKAQTESMEGAAFFLVCLSEKIPCAQIRAISNYTGERDKSQWDIEKALATLTLVFPDIISEALLLFPKNRVNPNQFQ